MLKCTVESLSLEIIAAREALKSRVDAMRDDVEAYEGLTDKGRAVKNPENYAYEYLSLMIPRIVFDNPRVKASSDAFGGEQQAEAIQYAINRWVRDGKYNEHLTRLAIDMSFLLAVSCVTQTTKRVGNKTVKGWPQVSRIGPARVLIDPVAEHWSRARFIGHTCVEDKDTLLKRAKDNPDEGWNASLIEGLALEAGTDLLGRPEFAKKAPQRNEVVYYELWVPEYVTDDEDGFHGTIFTIAEGQNRGSGEDGWIREPRAFYGPASGPYTFYGCYTVPDRVFPLAPLAAVRSQGEEVNQHARSISRSAVQYKRLVLVGGSNNKLVQDIRKTPDSFVIPVPTLSADEVVTIELGGVTDQQLAQFGVVKDRLDRMLAMSDAARGVVTGDGSATENTIAAEASGTRTAGIKKPFTDAVKEELKRVAWYFWNDSRITFELDAKMLKEVGWKPGFGPVPRFKGGPSREQRGSYEELGIEIEPYSMERTSEAQQQRQFGWLVNLIVTIAPLVPQTPWVRWNDVLKQAADTANNPQIADIIDVELANAVAQLQVAAGAAEPAMRLESPTAPQPGGGVGGIYGGGQAAQPQLKPGAGQQVAAKPMAAPKPQAKPKPAAKMQAGKKVGAGGKR